MPTSEYLDFPALPAGRFHLLDWGRPRADATPVLLVHGFNQTAHSWDEFAVRARGEFWLLAVDQRGHGHSAWAREGDYRRDVMAEDLAQIMDRLDLSCAVVVGMSMGAAHSAILAARHPRRVAALVLVDWAPAIEAAGFARIKVLSEMSWPSFDDAVRAALAFNPRRGEENIRERLGHSLRETPDGRFTWRADVAGFLRELQGTDADAARRGEEMWQRVGEVRCPTLLVRGADSDVVSPEAADALSDALSGGELVTVASAGHSVSGDNPDGFHAAVAPFLRRVS